MDSHNTSTTIPDRLNKYLSNPLAKTSSDLTRSHKEKTTCLAYICPHAARCGFKTTRPAKVSLRNCIGQNGKSLHDGPNLSSLSLDLLAKHKKRGSPLSPETLALLEDVRPNGPLR